MLFMIKINKMSFIYSVINSKMFLLVLCLISHLFYIVVTMTNKKPLPLKQEKEVFAV
ncbi:hypothetical protein Xkoz_01660 [Xenorhabdus kozodoii]|uniref:Uncharacterized protein n=1 Tax=Xenorhabdus kozodoii TaxID=351676 RepID=A0A2D0LCU8_9GAMM|nr:hypothetical protein Xkoz_01660 [Xenorhabdus kozodoii]